MSTRAIFYLLMAVSLIAVTACTQARAAEVEDQSIQTVSAEAPAGPADPVDLYDAIDAGDVNVKFIAKSDRRGKFLIENPSDLPIDVVIPAAFVARPALEQNFGGGGGGLGGGGGGLGGGGGGGQSVGGGGGGLGGGGQGGGGGGLFSIPPAKTAKIDVSLLCLDHGKKNPSASKPYELVRPEEHLGGNRAVVELLEAYGRGELQRGAAQAAVWNLNNGVTWQELAAKLDGTVRSFVRSPYFSRAEIEAGIAYAAEATRRAALHKATEPEESSDESMSSRYSHES